MKGVHEHLLPFFPDYDYRKPAPGVVVDYRKPDNACGHQQRAVTTWWALQMGGPLDLGLDFGSHRGLTPYAIHVDAYYDNETEHRFYGGKIPCDLKADAADPSRFFCPSTFPFIASNHSLEHMPADGDAGIVALLRRWVSLLRVGGVLVMVVPDNDHWDVMASDRNHYHAWGASDFPRRVLEPLLAGGGLDLVEFNTLGNFFSFQVVLRRTA